MKKWHIFMIFTFLIIMIFGIVISPTYNYISKVSAAPTVASESQVRLVQQRLRDWGYYDGPVTGYYGELTKAAIIRFQKKHGLNAEGYLGPLTLEKIGIYVPSVTTTGGTPYDSIIITKVQQRLKE